MAADGTGKGKTNGDETDLLTAGFCMDELRESYQQYLVPAAKILIGKEAEELVQATGVRLESLRVSLNLDSAASAEFSVSDIWDGSQSAVRQNVKSTLVCGAMVQIMLGYGSELTDVFHGFIYETSIQFSDMPLLQVTAMDVKRLMADNVQMDKVWTGQTRAGIFSALMEQYAVFGLNASVEEREGQSDEEQEKMENFVQRGSDFSLVRRLCREGGLRFVVYGHTAKLTADKEEDPVLTLVWGKDLLSFAQTMRYVNVKIEVRGTVKKPTQRQPDQGGTEGDAQSDRDCDKKDSSVIVLTETVCSAGVEETGIPTADKVIEITNLKGEDEAAVRLADEVDSVKESMYSGRGSCIGMPVLIPGRYIGIDGIDADSNGSYFLKSVNHMFGADGFTTEFTLEGKKEESQ